MNYTISGIKKKEREKTESLLPLWHYLQLLHNITIVDVVGFESFVYLTSWALRELCWSCPSRSRSYPHGLLLPYSWWVRDRPLPPPPSYTQFGNRVRFEALVSLWWRGGLWWWYRVMMGGLVATSCSCLWNCFASS